LLEDKDLMMNFGDKLLAVDGLDIEGKNLDNIRNMLQDKSSNRVKLTFLNKEWFNRFDRDSVKTVTKITTLVLETVTLILETIHVVMMRTYF
jgi:C-terminal processing protease CtpA/Prc